MNYISKQKVNSRATDFASGLGAQFGFRNQEMVNCFHLDLEKKATFKRTFYNETFGRSGIHNSHVSNSFVRNHNCVLFLCASAQKIIFLLCHARLHRVMEALGNCSPIQCGCVIVMPFLSSSMIHLI